MVNAVFVGGHGKRPTGTAASCSMVNVDRGPIHGDRRMPDYESRHSLDPLVADTLRRYRQARRWSYRRAAKEIGISFGMLAMLEGGTRAPSTVVAEELIHAYRMNIADAEALRDVALSGVGRDWAPRPTNRHTEGASPCRP